MADSINIKNFNNTLYFSRIDHDTFCEYRLPGHGLMWVRSGSMEIASKDSVVSAKPGQFIFWQRDCASSMKKLSDGDTPYCSVALTFSKPLLKEYFRKYVAIGKLRDNIQPFGETATLLPETVDMESLFYSLLPYDEKNIEPTLEVTESKIMEAIDILLKIDNRFYPTLFDFHETWKIDLYDFMKSHFTEDLAITEFASYSGRSLATFKRDFAKISNETPQKWIIRERLKFAANLIISENAKPSDIYERAGFKNKAHFFKSFKNMFGCTPIEYRKQKNSNVIKDI